MHLFYPTNQAECERPCILMSRHVYNTCVCMFVWFYVVILGYIRLKYINGRQSSIESLTKLTLLYVDRIYSISKAPATWHIWLDKREGLYDSPLSRLPIASQRATSFEQSGPKLHTTRSTGSVMSEACSKPYLLLFLFLPSFCDLPFLACCLSLLPE